MLRILLSVVALLYAPAAIAAQAAPGATRPPPAPSADGVALAAAVRDLCHRDVALLGEADHGDGRTIEFKVALVQQLIGRCRYNAVFFESSHYQFLDLSRRLRTRQTVSPDMISAAIGGVWKFDEELAPLIPFLFAEASAGRLALGGIDDQVGGFQQAYANDEMPAELTAYLPADRRAECRELLRQRIRYNFPAPYAEAGRARILRCLADIGAALRLNRQTDRRTREDLIQMTASFERSLARDFMQGDAFLRAREPSLYTNFRWLAGRLPPRSRIIVWSATSHIAKDASAMRRYESARNFGSFIHDAYGPRAFALGFSALSGSYRAFGGARDNNVETLTPAAAASLEGRAIAGNGIGAVYLGAAELARLGTVQGSAFFHEPLTADWSRILDGIVIFPEQRPTRRNPPR